MVKKCGENRVADGREGVPGAYSFFSRYVLSSSDSCLDVGGGLGVGLKILRQRSSHVKAIDKDVRLSEFGVQLGDVRDEPDGSWDWVTCVDVIEHVEDDAGFLRHLARVSRKGVFITTPNRDHHPDRAWPYHVREYTAQEFSTLFSSVCKGGYRYHFGASTYCGGISRSHLNHRWEHQGILWVARRWGWISLVLGAREWALKMTNR